MCWLDDAQLAVWGYGDDDDWMRAAVRVFDVRSGDELRWFPGPRGTLVFDRVLIALAGDHGATVWHHERGTRLLADTRPAPGRYHPTAKVFVAHEHTYQSELVLARLCGHDAAWSRGAIAELAAAIARERSFEEALPVLGDALEAADCRDAEMLAHCRNPGPHGERCWVLDRLARR
jgi:hypothetical protein